MTPLRLSDFDYVLPPERIAQTPLSERDRSRLLLLDRRTGALSHRHFYDLPALLFPGDVLVLNDTRVTATRLFGARMGKENERVEVFLTHRVSGEIWAGLGKPGKKLLPGVTINFDGDLTATVLEKTDERGGRTLQLTSKSDKSVDEILEDIGNSPLPPYIETPLPRENKERYQTVYARGEGSAAAPTAGLHFTPELLEKIERRGVKIAHVTLHVGLGTFRPIVSDDITTHQMHAERVTVTEEAAELVNGATGRIIAVGTTSARTLESAATDKKTIRAMDGETSLYVTPGYEFQILDALITNFHLPRSTLFVLVSALAGRENIQNAYAEAIAEDYRFLSFGDAMLIS